MYTTKRYTIYNHRTGEWYAGSGAWFNMFDMAKLYRKVGFAKSGLSQPGLGRDREDCSIYNVRIELGDKVEE
ncbi:MAG: hypothetical protein CMF22_10515 [Idiomarinaceae bacterium]|nr:hypothetical protein [Idiomarinaceae bacterium]MBG23873.1 hypothetical protein [Idiomarinaceae bacterium]